jgi:hypothetical protein
MTPASSGEVDELLEPVWSWPERIMLATDRRRAASPAEPRCRSSDREDHGATPQPTPSAALTVRT